MKNLLNLKGAQLLSKKEQQSINGGDAQHDCEMAGGTWVSIGANCSEACGCVFEKDPNPPMQ